jgi:hypothetical protein
MKYSMASASLITIISIEHRDSGWYCPITLENERSWLR